MFVRLLLAGFVAFLAAVIYSVDTGSAPGLWDRVYSIPYYDKFGHLVLMGILSLLANLSLGCKTIRFRYGHVMLGTVIVLLVVAIEEASQAFIATRSCDLADFAADVAGIVLGAMAAKTIQRGRPAAGQLESAR